MAHTTSSGLSCGSLVVYAMMVEDKEQAPPPARFTLWPLCTDQCSPNSSLVEKESQVDLPFLCCFLPGLEQLYWLSLSLSSGLVFKYSWKYVASPGLIPAALWRHSWVFVKAGALTVNISLALCHGTLPAWRPDLQQLLCPEQAQAPEQRISEVTSQNLHLVFIGKAGPPFGPDPDNLPWEAAGTGARRSNWREEMENYKTSSLWIHLAQDQGPQTQQEAHEHLLYLWSSASMDDLMENISEFRRQETWF